MGYILLRVSFHQTNVRYTSHCTYVKLTVCLDIVDNLLIHSRVTPIGNDALAIFEFLQNGINLRASAEQCNR